MSQDDSDDAVLRLPASYPAALATLLGLGTALAATLLPAPLAQVDVRFCNATESALGGLRSSGATFGDIAAGQCSGYRRLSRSYSSVSFAAESRGARVEHYLDDHVGDRELAQGRYTFRIRALATGLAAELQ